MSDPDLPDGWSTDAHVSRWQAGEDAAFVALHQRFAPLLAMRIRGSRLWPLLERSQSVEDLLQTVWTRVLPAARESFTPSGKGSFLAYLGQVADRTAIDEVRRLHAARRNHGERAQSLEGGAESSGRPLLPPSRLETPTSCARTTELLQLARQTLSEREFAAWELNQIQGYSFEEVGLSQSCTAASARGLCFRARRKLIGALGGSQIAERANGEPPSSD